MAVPVPHLPVLVSNGRIPEIEDCFPMLIHFHAEGAGVRMMPQFSYEDIEQQADFRELFLQKRLHQFDQFYRTTLHPALQIHDTSIPPPDPDMKLWLQEYIQKRLRPDMCLDDYINLMKPLLVAFAVILQEVKSQYKVTIKFARLSLDNAENFLAHPEKLRTWLKARDHAFAMEKKAQDEALIVDSYLNQERHPQSVTTFDTKTSTSAQARAANCCEHHQKH